MSLGVYVKPFCPTATLMFAADAAVARAKMLNDVNCMVAEVDIIATV
jgi:hypothetical protein